MKPWKNSARQFLQRLQSPPWMVVAVCLVTIALHGSAVFNEFYFDDRSQILEGRLIRSWQNVPDIFTSEVWHNVERGDRLASASVDTFRPLFNLSLLVDFQLVGKKPFLYHGVNLAIHLINIILVFLIADALLGGVSALFTAALFALHPTTVTCIHYVSARPDSAATLFSLLTVLLAIQTPTLRPARHAAMAVTFLCAMLWKETAIVMPVLVPILQRVSRKDVSWKSTGLCALTLCTTLGLYFALRWQALGATKAVEDSAHFFAMVLHYPRAVLDLAQAALFILVPLPLRSFDSSAPASVPFIATVVVFYLGAGSLVLWGILRRQLWAGLVAWALFAMAPPVTAMVRTDRLDGYYFYMPTAGLALLVGLLVRWLSTRMNRRRLLLWLQGAILATAGLLSFVAARHFRTEVSFYRAIIAAGPHSPIADYNLANAYMRQSMHNEAVAQYQKVLAIHPRDARSHNNFSVALLALHRVGEAVHHGRLAIALDPRNPRHHYNLALALLRDGQTLDGLRALDTSLTLDPAYPAARAAAQELCRAPRHAFVQEWCRQKKGATRK